MMHLFLLHPYLVAILFGLFCFAAGFVAALVSFHFAMTGALSNTI